MDNDGTYVRDLEQESAQQWAELRRLRAELNAANARAERAEDVAKRIAGHLRRPAHHMTGTQMAATFHAIRSLVLPYIETDKLPPEVPDDD